MYTLKNVSVNQRMSEETTCFVADVYRNGVKVLSVQNRGCGGSHNYNEYVKGSIAEADTYAKTLPAIVYQGVTIAPDLDSMIDDLLNEHLLEKDAKKYMKKFCFKEDGNLYTMNVSPDCAKTAAYFADTYPNAVIIRDIESIIAHLRAGQCHIKY
jgi:hypothetical protein